MPESVDDVDYFTPSQREDIYYDEYFGMNSTRKLVLWVTATDGPNYEDSEQRKAQDFIVEHFSDKGMTAEKL